MIASWRNVAKSGTFARNASVVMMGTMAAQALPLMFYPILSRLYTPADFGTFATVALAASCLAVVASGVFEQALLLLRSDRTAAALFRFILRRSLAVMIAAQVLLALAGGAIAQAFDDPALRIALLVVPLIAFGQVIYNCTAEWLVRATAFGPLTVMRILQSSVLAVPKLGFGLWLGAGPGLVWGEAVGRLAYIAYSYWAVWRRPLRVFARNRARAYAAARRYRNFPRLMVPDQLLNILSGSIHVFFIGTAFGPEQLGYVSLLLSALYLPITVVSSSVKDVFRQRASVEYARDGTCRPLYRRLVLPLALVGAVGFAALYWASSWIFELVFGGQWAPLGDYARILMPFFFFNFVSMSLAGVLVIAERMNVSLMWQVANLLLAVVALAVGCFVLESITATLALFTIARSLGYLFYMGLSYYYAKRPVPAAAVTPSNTGMLP